MADQNAAASPKLHFLDGATAPPALAPSLMRIMELPERVRARFVELVLPHLEQAPDDQLDEGIFAACRDNELDVEVAGTAIKATRFVIRQAAALEVGAQQLGQDISALGGSVEMVEAITTLYERSRGDLRREIAQVSVLAHGKVLTGVEWRVDNMTASNRGRAINLPVALLTLHYRDGDRERRITLQALPDAINMLREVCEHLVG
jgi:hypothetical protein